MAFSQLLRGGCEKQESQDWMRGRSADSYHQSLSEIYTYTRLTLTKKGSVNTVCAVGMSCEINKRFYFSP